MQNILVIGGAGYIGSHMCKYLAKNGYQSIVLDNFVHGHRDAVRWGPFFKGSASNSELLKHIFSNHQISAVMHFAAYCYVGESVDDPGKYYANNVAKTIALLQEMIKHNVQNFIFSSSCAIYGEPIEIPIPENHPQNPINPYGRSKLMVEQILEDFKKAHGLKYVSLRYFNAAGADPESELGEDHRPETHLIPLALQTALRKREILHIFGNDYPTRDGTCIRDYIHIEDLAQAHLLAMEKLFSNMPAAVFNLGNGSGYSVKEVVELANKITQKQIKTRITERRTGDPAVLIGSSHKAEKELGWKPQFSDLFTIIETAWKWHQKHPDGYRN